MKFSLKKIFGKGKKWDQAPIYMDGQMGKEKLDEGSGQG